MMSFALLLLAGCPLQSDDVPKAKPVDSTVVGDSGSEADTAPDPTADLDGDGFVAADDCNDNLDWVHPGTTDWCGDGVDEDCVDGDCELFGITLTASAAATLTGGHAGDIEPGASSLLQAPGSPSNLLTTGEDSSGNLQIYVVDLQVRGLAPMSDVGVRLTTNSATIRAQEFAGAGDLDGDGYGDLVATIFDDSEGRFSSADAYVFHGPFDAARSFADSGPTVVGGGDDGFGSAVARAGDVNDDGLDDLWIGAPDAPNSQGPPGAITLWFGPLDHRREIGEFDGLWQSEGPTNLGGRFVNPGDIDGDGHDELLIVANNNCGLYLVVNPGSGVHELSTADARWCIPGADILGLTFARNAGGDGGVVVGLGGLNIEEILFFDGTLRGDLSVDDARAVVVFGEYVAEGVVTADWDGDGTADLALSTAEAQAFLLRGPFEGFRAIEGVDGRIVSNTSGGTPTLLGVPDLDDDGDDELVATTRGEEGEGAVYLFLGAPQ